MQLLPLRTHCSIFILSLSLACASFASAQSASSTQAPSVGLPQGAAPGGPGSQASTSKVSCVEGDWSFDLVTTQVSDIPGGDAGGQKTSTITYYSGKTASVVAIPAILGGAPVTRIASQAFGHHGEIAAVYVPDSVVSVDDWAFYDLNGALVISFANPDVSIDDGAFQSSGNAALYLPLSSQVAVAGGKTAVREGSASLGFTLQNTASAAISGGLYLDVLQAGEWRPSAETIASMAQAASGEASDVVTQGTTLVFSGPAYQAQAQTVSIWEGFIGKVSEEDLDQVFASYTAEEAASLMDELRNDSRWAPIAGLYDFHGGYYLNGNPVSLDASIVAYDVQTGEPVAPDASTGLLPATGSGQYKYVAAQDSDDDGDLDLLYYSPYSRTYSYSVVTISGDQEDLRGMKARDLLNPLYLSFANAVLSAKGDESKVVVDRLEAASGRDGSSLGAAADQERSLLWADDYGVIEAGVIHGSSDSVGNWAKISRALGLDAYNVEIIMEWGMNALLYATNGGVLKVGTPSGERSSLYASGDGANGIVAGGAGTMAGSAEAPSPTSSVYLTNADLTLEGWNNHVADVVYGGYATLTDVKASTGKKGSYAVGQSSALANDFGNGVVEATNFHAVTYGNRSAGVYVIGGGIIRARDSSFESLMDAGLVIASGGHLVLDGSSALGQIGLRNRGGINVDSVSTLSDSSLTVRRDLSGYVTGKTASAAVSAWRAASGSAILMHAYMSDPSMTLGRLCDIYGVTGTAREKLYSTLGALAASAYSDETMLRNSVLDNSFYNYSSGSYSGSTDFSEVPYLTVGSSFGGLVGSVLEFESAGLTLNLERCKFSNESETPYDYFVASEAGSAPVIVVADSEASGLVWNEGDVVRSVEGRQGMRSSSVDISFQGSAFTGAFADGDNGLTAGGVSYADASGATTERNGNYYGAAANWGIVARFDSSSTWNVTGTSYLGTLILEPGTLVKAPVGVTVTLTVNGQTRPLQAGTYTGQVVVKVE